MSSSRKLLWHLPWVLLIWLALAGGLFSSTHYWLEEQRASQNLRPSSGDIIFLGIDTNAIEKVGVWPWPRAVHAQIIDKLVAMDVRQINIDIDFSSLSDPENDIRLAGSIANADGKVVLPLFVQDRSANTTDNNLALNQPLSLFSQNSQLANVNVVADDDGAVRNFMPGMTINGTYYPSFASALAGNTEPTEQSINVNYSIDPKTIPTYSVADFLDGKLDPADFKNKTVAYGAQAIELRDNFSTPVHGSLPGSMVQILAAETLIQNISVTPINPSVTFVAASLLILCFVFFMGKSRMRWQIAALSGFAILIEIGGLYLYANHSLFLASTPILALIIGSMGLAILFEVDVQRLSAVFENVSKRNSERLFDKIFEDNVCGIIIIDENIELIKQNQTAMRFLAAKSGCLPDTLARAANETLIAISNNNATSDKKGELSLPNTNGDNRIFEYVVTASRLEQLQGGMPKGSIDRYVACITFWDVTERRVHQKKLEYLANFDELTGALRRSAFEQELEKDFDCTVFAINLHRFKTINLSLGRDVGDKVLSESVRRLETLIDGSGDHTGRVGRLSGDSFVLSLPHQLTPEQSEEQCELIIKALTRPMMIDRAEIHVGARVGAATRFDETQATKLLSQAEFALDEARKINGNAYFLHQISLSERQRYLRELETDLFSAIDKQELHTVYQPQFSIETGAMTGVECLVRWQHPTFGFIPPSDFIALAEANGFIDQLGEWVLNVACRDALTLPEHMTMAVNFTPAQIMRCDTPKIVANAIRAHGLSADRLHIEITEIGILEASDKVVNDLVELREMGISIALDDFGTGFSTLDYFTNFPINKIKIDQVFVRNMKRGSADEAIIRSVKELSSCLNMKLVCEGIETQEQLAILQEIGADEGQGYLFSRPTPIDQLHEMLSDETRISA